MQVTAQDMQLIDQIADRAVRMLGQLNAIDSRRSPFFKVQVAAELLTVHRDIVPLRLEEMLHADLENFAHDIGGIHRHLTFSRPPQLRDCFLPRFANV